MQKKNLLILILLLIGLGGYGQTNVKTPKSNKKKIIIKTKVYCNHCTQCESCKARVENKVLELKGIRSVEMKPEKNKIEVIYNPKFINVSQIREQIAAAGYDADKIKATPEQVAQLEGCCKKK